MAQEAKNAPDLHIDWLIVSQFCGHLRADRERHLILRSVQTLVHATLSRPQGLPIKLGRDGSQTRAQGLEGIGVGGGFDGGEEALVRLLGLFVAEFGGNGSQALAQSLEGRGVGGGFDGSEEPVNYLNY